MAPLSNRFRSPCPRGSSRHHHFESREAPGDEFYAPFYFNFNFPPPICSIYLSRSVTIGHLLSSKVRHGSHVIAQKKVRGGLSTDALTPLTSNLSMQSLSFWHAKLVQIMSLDLFRPQNLAKPLTNGHFLLSLI